MLRLPALTPLLHGTIPPSLLLSSLPSLALTCPPPSAPSSRSGPGRLPCNSHTWDPRGGGEGAGGGAALLHLSELIPAFKETLTDDEEKLGADIVYKSLRAPARLIAQNAGVEGDVIVEQLLGKDFKIGYNAVCCLLQTRVALP